MRADRPRLALVGCGAVARLYAAPALALLAGRGALDVSALFDPAPAAAKAVAALLGGGRRIAPSFEDALRDADAVLIASPPNAHRAQCEAAFARGLDVFCEKPLAIMADEAAAIVGAARAAGKVLDIGMIRRALPATGLVASLLKTGALGRLRAVTWFEGGPFNWPVASPAYFSRAVSGGGVLLDLGPHILDLLHWWLGPTKVLGCEDDAMGGVEANCRLRLEDAAGTPVEIRLSRDWARPNRVEITGDTGALRWEINEIAEISLKLADQPDFAKLVARDAPPSFVDAYARQLERFLERRQSSSAPSQAAANAPDILATIDEAYAASTMMGMPWRSAREQSAAIAARGRRP